MSREENMDSGKPKANSKECTKADTDQGNFLEEKGRFFCPVCGKPMSEKYLPYIIHAKRYLKSIPRHQVRA